MQKAPDTMEKLHYHLIGIGGTAMASVAGLLRAAGHEVTGSDENVYPPMSDQLRDLGARRIYGRPRPPPRLIVHGDCFWYASTGSIYGGFLKGITAVHRRVGSPSDRFVQLTTLNPRLTLTSTVMLGAPEVPVTAGL